MSATISNYLREPVNALTHLAGIVLSVVALILLISRSIEEGSITMLAAYTIFGISLILLYTSSTLYHSVQAPLEKIRKLQKFDHMMIYVLIAGTFTPFCLVAIGGTMGVTLMSIMWVMAFLGAILKFFMGGEAGWISITIYIAMGWAGIALIPLMMNAVPVNGMIWLATGGVIYTIGAIIYGLEKPNPLPKRFGYHEIWHLFVLAGSFAHFWTVYRYVGII